jgi:hypothetical protein
MAGWNQRSRTRALLFSASLVMVLLGASTLNCDRQATPEATPSSTQTKAGGQNPELAFDPNIQRLPPGFVGNDIKAIWKRLTEIHSSDSKDEFETTEEFRKRLDHQSSLPLIGSLTAKSTLAFVVSPEISKYDADAGILRMSARFFSVINGPFEDRAQQITVDYASSSVEGVGENAFGAQRPIEIATSTSYSLAFWNSELRYSKKDGRWVHWTVDADTKERFLLGSTSLARDQASNVKDKVRGLVICKLVPPFASEWVGSVHATIDDPTELHLTERDVFISVLGFWFFDSASGRILDKVVSR